ncbi:MAG TPA: hypothetical protein VGN32_11935 [Ktedonobacterales bacterium]|nr:hypothetical protein [Ktedonobacterales bacterium]
MPGANRFWRQYIMPLSACQRAGTPGLARDGTDATAQLVADGAQYFSGKNLDLV